MKLISLTCPNCNANLDNIDPSLKQCYCQYCGTKIMLDDGTIRKETHIYDEAKIKETESKEVIELKKLEIKQERERKQRDFGKKSLMTAGVMLIIAFFLNLFMRDSDTSFIIGIIGVWIAIFGIILIILSFLDEQK